MLCSAFDDVEDPVQTAIRAVSGHEGTDIAGVNLGGLCYHSELLGGVFGDVFRGTGVDEIDFEGWDGVFNGRGGGIGGIGDIS